jgi:hypothetical protein
VKEILKDVAERKISVDEAEERFKHLFIEEIEEFAKIDHHRKIRCGLFEVIFGKGKRKEEIVEIAKRLLAKDKDLFITQTTEDIYLAIKEVDERVKWHKIASAITLKQKKEKKIGPVLILTGGTADIPVAEEAAVTLDMMNVSVEKGYDVGVAGIHRLFSQAEKLKNARCIIAVAGMDGALASVVAGLVDTPVIGVPTSVGYGASFSGISALLSMLNSCAPGVCCVNIDNGFSAGYIAGLIAKRCL